jgi:NTE family protein
MFDVISIQSNRWLPIAAVAMTLLLSACSAHYTVNEPTGQRQIAPGEIYGLRNPALGGRHPSMLFLVSFSGGGTRAAAFSYGVLEELAKTSVSYDGENVRLLDEIDGIMSVSGGSFTAAYYGLFGDRIFEDFDEKFLKKNVQGMLTRGLLSPFSWPKLASPYYGRSELAADLYDRILFEGKTYRDLLDRKGPAVFINATDVALGAQFTFSTQQFYPLCSDLLDFPVSRAVTASSAVPVAFNTVVLGNYSGTCPLSVPDWFEEVLERRDTRTRQYHQAVLLSAYLDAEERPFIHLLDGGLSDNLGVRTLLDQVFVRGGVWNALKQGGMEHMSKIVVMVVNAEADRDLSSAKRDTSIPLFDTIKASSSVPLNHYSFETVALLRQQMDLWEGEIADGRCREMAEKKASGEAVQSGETACSDITTYLIEVNLQLISDPEERAFLQSQPTSFTLEPDAVDHLKDAGARVLNKSPEFQQLLQDLR